MTQTADGAEVTLDSGEMIKAQYVVAADGMNSTIRDIAGLGHDGNDALSLSFTLADVRVAGGLPVGQVLLFFSKPGMLVVAPLPDGSFPGSCPRSTMRRSSRTSPIRSNCSTLGGHVVRR